MAELNKIINMLLKFYLFFIFVLVFQPHPTEVLKIVKIQCLKSFEN